MNNQVPNTDPKQEKNMTNAITAVVTFEEFQPALIAAAKQIQGDGYVGDDYYTQPQSWRSYWADGHSPREAVIEDMSYWDGEAANA